jgi:hypothetical protein
MNEQKFPPGWDAERVKRLIELYESLDEDAQVAEDEAAFETKGQTTVVVPRGINACYSADACRKNFSLIVSCIFSDFVRQFSFGHVRLGKELRKN